MRKCRFIGACRFKGKAYFDKSKCLNIRSVIVAFKSDDRLLCAIWHLRNEVVHTLIFIPSLLEMMWSVKVFHYVGDVTLEYELLCSFLLCRRWVGLLYFHTNPMILECIILVLSLSL